MGTDLNPSIYEAAALPLSHSTKIQKTHYPINRLKTKRLKGKSEINYTMKNYNPVETKGE